MVNTIYLLSFVETPRKFIIAELSIRKLGSSSVLIIRNGLLWYIGMVYWYWYGILVLVSIPYKWIFLFSNGFACEIFRCKFNFKFATVCKRV